MTGYTYNQLSKILGTRNSGMYQVLNLPDNYGDSTGDFLGRFLGIKNNIYKNNDTGMHHLLKGTKIIKRIR